MATPKAQHTDALIFMKHEQVEIVIPQAYLIEFINQYESIFRRDEESSPVYKIYNHPGGSHLTIPMKSFDNEIRLIAFMEAFCKSRDINFSNKHREQNEAIDKAIQITIKSLHKFFEDNARKTEFQKVILDMNVGLQIAKAFWTKESVEFSVPIHNLGVAIVKEYVVTFQLIYPPYHPFVVYKANSAKNEIDDQLTAHLNSYVLTAWEA